MLKVPGTLYLGDGVYARFDGENLWLLTERIEPPRQEDGYIHEIALNRDNWNELLAVKNAQVTKGQW